jgi:hypothetical protein
MTRLETPPKTSSRKLPNFANPSKQKPTLFDSTLIGDPHAAIDFITNILESSTEYSVIAKDLTGKIVLWNEGAQALRL